MPALFRRISRPPPAASAAGGRGIPVSRCVYSVEALRCQAAGVLEVEARRPVFAGGGSPLRRRRSVELRCRFTAFVALASLRRSRGRLPLARRRGRRCQQQLIYRKILLRFGATTTWCRSSTGAWRLPVRLGTASDPRLEGGSDGGVSPTAPACWSRGQRSEGLCCNFVFLQGPFCNVSELMQ